MKLEINKLIPNKDNPRIIKDDKFKKLVKSIKEFPEMLELRPIVVDEDMVILGGNMRHKACIEAGLTEVPIKIAEGLTEEQKQEFIVKDNVGFGEWEWDILANEWDSVQLTEWGLDVWENLDDKKPEDGLIDDDEIPEVKESKVKLGDIWKLGEHRIMCGDSTSVNDMDKLMKNKKAKLSFTSPPYNAGKSELLSGNTHTTDNKYNTYNDNQKQTDYLNLLIGFTNNALLNSEYLICNIQSLAGNKVALIDYLYKYKNNFIDVAIWDKGHGAPAMAKNVMTSAWEYMFFISSKENATRAIPEANFRGTIPNIYRGKPQRNNEFSKVHAATFPIDLPEWVIEFTKNKDIILDQFLGTGTTLIAAQKLNRICYGMELDEKYCDIIIERWEQFTGKKAEKL